MIRDYRSKYVRKRQPAGAGAFRPPVPAADHSLDAPLGIWRPAGFWLRLLAWMVDASTIAIIAQILSVALSIMFALSFEKLVLVLGQTLAAMPALGSLDAESLRRLAAISAWAVIFLAGAIVYNPIFESSPLQATPGKVLIGIYVISVYGYRCNFPAALLRNTLKVFSALALMIGFLMTAVRKDGQAFHDLIASCYVVRIPEISRFRLMTTVAFAVAFTMVTFLTVHFETDKVLLRAVERRAKHGQGVPAAPPVQQPTAAPVRGVGRLGLAGKERTLVDAFVRVSEKASYGGDFVRRLADGTKQIEVLLFGEKLGAEERQQLETVPALLASAEERIGKRPLAAFVLYYSPTAVYCNIEGLQRILLVLHPEAAQALPSRIEVHDLTGDFMRGSGNTLRTSCFELQPGKTFSVKTYGRESLGAGESLSWSFVLNAPLTAYRTLGTFDYESYQSAIALYSKGPGRLSIGLYPRKMSEQDAAAIKQQASLTAVAHNQPDMIGEMLLQKRTPVPRPETRPGRPPRDENIVNLDMVRDGYSLRLYRNEGGQMIFPGEKSEIALNYEPGATPRTLYGALDEGAQIAGRFEGQWVGESNEGVFTLRWAVPFNALVIVVD